MWYRFRNKSNEDIEKEFKELIEYSFNSADFQL
jgi:hypothetical protein